MTDKNFITASLITNPENIFDRKPLFYSMREVSEVVSRFDDATNRPSSYSDIRTLLQAMLEFLASTSTDNELRRLTYTDEDTQKVFSDMQHALQHAEKICASLEDKIIFAKVIAYCKVGLLKHSQEFNSDKQLQEIWDKSRLKKIVEE